MSDVFILGETEPALSSCSSSGSSMLWYRQYSANESGNIWHSKERAWNVLAIWSEDSFEDEPVITSVTFSCSAIRWQKPCHPSASCTSSRKEISTFLAGLRDLVPVLVEHIVQEGNWSWSQAVICEVEIEDAVSQHAGRKEMLYELELVESLARSAHSRDDVDQIERSGLGQIRYNVLARLHFRERKLERFAYGRSIVRYCFHGLSLSPASRGYL